MSQFNENETEAIRGGVMGAIALVSQAEPGFFATFKESVAASNALKDAPDDFRRLMTGGLVMPPQACSKEEMIRQIRALERVSNKDMSKAAGYDPAETSQLGIFSEMSLVEVCIRSLLLLSLLLLLLLLSSLSPSPSLFLSSNFLV